MEGVVNEEFFLVSVERTGIQTCNVERMLVSTSTSVCQR